ncbi:uroporphyrinogen-III synthase [Halobacillus salinarum]|uniref:Uroporphyrinogen-III synthase n=1 Tax=Halobacillus salinarum TaxID=2932257 RepID=A0ABY4EP49_9BACI|nr:uroporphyrinogen-III synthase [Halobacillus salinarum]UOQ46238.1 uroporphyrinogen-III synthase [Halobacillus salinarum]
MRTLAGKHILVTRAKSQARPLSALIETHGGVAVETPLLSFQLHDSKEHDRLLAKLHEFSWIFVTSANGVKFFFELLSFYNADLPQSLKWAVVGTRTEDALNKYGVKADFVPEKFNARSLSRSFFQKYDEPGRLLFVRGNRSRDEFIQAMKQEQVFFQTMTVYDTIPVEHSYEIIQEKLRLQEIDGLTFTSPSTIDAFMDAIQNTNAKALHLPCFCIGPTTGARAEERGFSQVIEPSNFSIKDMMDKIIDYFSEEGKR